MLPNILGIIIIHLMGNPIIQPLETKKGVLGLKKLAMDREVTNDD